MLKKLTIGLLGGILLLFLGSASPNFNGIGSELIISKIEINIIGASTVGKYNCSSSFIKRDTIAIQLRQKNSFKAEIPMLQFDCGNKIMTKDMHSTVKATQFPSSFVTLSDIQPAGNNYKCNLAFLITNKTIRLKDFVLIKNDNKLQGVIGLKFSDIGLTPPVKMGGLIKVKDDIIINFSLYK